MQVISEAIGAIAVLQNRSYTFRRRPRIFVGLGTRNKNSFVSLIAHHFMTPNKRRTVDL